MEPALVELPKVSIGTCPKNFSNEQFFSRNAEITTDASVRRYLGGLLHRPPETPDPAVLSYFELSDKLRYPDFISRVEIKKKNVEPWMIALLIEEDGSDALTRRRYPALVPEGVKELPEAFAVEPAENIFWVWGHMIRVCRYGYKWDVRMNTISIDPFRAGNRILFLA
jgi:hypothetical protein